jgi:hypothetical protein
MVTKENQRFLLVYKVMNDIVTIIQKIKPYDWSKTMRNEIIGYNITSGMIYYR